MVPIGGKEMFYITYEYALLWQRLYITFSKAELSNQAEVDPPTHLAAHVLDKQWIYYTEKSHPLRKPKAVLYQISE